MCTYLLEQVCTCMCVHMARYSRENCPKEGRDCSGQFCLAVFVVHLVGPDTPVMVRQNQAACGTIYSSASSEQALLPVLLYFRRRLRALHMI